MECPICLEIIGPTVCLGRIRECQHVYHDQCLLQWSAHSNSCPTCRKSFHGIDIVAFSAPDRIIRSVSVQDKILGTDAINNIPAEFVNPPQIPHILPSSASREDAISQQNGVCLICSSAQVSARRTTIIPCVGCGANFHTTCLGHAGELHWFCPFCDCHQEFPISIPHGRTGLRRGHGGISRSGRRSNSRNGLGLVQRLGEVSNPVLIDDFTATDAPVVSESPVSSRTTSSARNGQLVLSETPLPGSSFNSSENFESEQSQGDTGLTFVGGVRSRSSVWNGGVLLRKQARELRNLTPDERSSWSVLENARSGIETEVAITADPTGTTQQRKKRRARAPTSHVNSAVNQETSSVAPQVAHDVSRNQSPPRSQNDIVNCDPSALSNNSYGHTPAPHMIISSESHDSKDKITRPSRISSLISQIRNRSTNSYNAQASNNYSSPESSSGLSILSGPQISSNEGSVANSDSRSDSPASPPSTLSTGLNEAFAPRALTLDEKSKVQSHVRTYLRPLYHSENPATRKIHSEDDYVRINKGVSRQVYAHIAQLCSEKGPEVYGEIFEGDQSKLKDLVGRHVWEWTHKK